MFDKMKQLAQMQKQAQVLKKELDNAAVDVTKVNGIRIRISGSQKFLGLEVAPELLKAENKERLEQDLLSSLNAAIAESQKIAAAKMKDLMPGMPGF